MGSLPSVIAWRRSPSSASSAYRSADGRFEIARGYSYGEPVWLLFDRGHAVWHMYTQPGFRLLRNAKARAEQLAGRKDT